MPGHAWRDVVHENTVQWCLGLEGSFEGFLPFKESFKGSFKVPFKGSIVLYRHLGLEGLWL